jgi:hypothetical protein
MAGFLSISAWKLVGESGTYGSSILIYRRGELGSTYDKNLKFFTSSSNSAKEKSWD